MTWLARLRVRWLYWAAFLEGRYGWLTRKARRDDPPPPP